MARIRTKRIPVYVTPGEWQAINAATSAAGLTSMSEFLRIAAQADVGASQRAISNLEEHIYTIVRELGGEVRITDFSSPDPNKVLTFLPGDNAFVILDKSDPRLGGG